MMGLSDTVAIVKVGNDLQDALKKAIHLIGGFDLKDGEKIVIKPNLSDLIDSNEGVTTSPELMAELIGFIREKSKTEIAIVESNHWVATADEEFNRLGYREITKKHGDKLINLSNDKKIKVKLEGYHLKYLNVPEILLNCDKLISVAKLKTHATQKISCILKNQFGLITERYKSEHHPYMSQVLTDLNSFYTPDLCIIDGLVALEGAGPSSGKPVKTGIIICGKNAVAVDSAAAKIMGFDPYEIPHLKFAAEHGIGRGLDLDKLKIVGESLNDVKMNFEFVPFFSYFLFRLGYLMMRSGRRISNVLNVFGKKTMGFGFMLAGLPRVLKKNPEEIWPFIYNNIKRKVARSLTKLHYCCS